LENTSKPCRRNTASHKEKEELFISKFNDLFDVGHADALQMMKLKPDRLFLINQRKKGRLGLCMVLIIQISQRKSFYRTKK